MEAPRARIENSRSKFALAGQPSKAQSWDESDASLSRSETLLLLDLCLPGSLQTHARSSPRADAGGLRWWADTVAESRQARSWLPKLPSLTGTYPHLHLPELSGGNHRRCHCPAIARSLTIRQNLTGRSTLLRKLGGIFGDQGLLSITFRDWRCSG